MTSDDAQNLLAELFERYADRVHGYLSCRVGRDKAADLVSETFLVAWRRIDSIPAEAQLAWLLGVARRTSANALRHARREEQFLVEAAPGSPVAGRDEADRSNTRLDVLAALRQLRPGDQEVLVLSAWYDLSAVQAAQVLGCSRGAYEVRLHTARERFRQQVHQRGTRHHALAPSATEMEIS